MEITSILFLVPFWSLYSVPLHCKQWELRQENEGKKIPSALQNEMKFSLLLQLQAC